LYERWGESVSLKKGLRHKLLIIQSLSNFELKRGHIYLFTNVVPKLFKK